MATAAQLRFARDKKAEDDIVSRQAETTQQNLQKKNRRMGIGRIAGTLLGAALTGGSSLAVQAAAAGLGSLAGQKLAQGSTRKLDPLEEGKFNRDITRDLQSEYDEGLSDLNRAAVQRAGSDAFSIFAVGGLKNVPGMEKLATAGEKFAAGGREGGARDVIRGGISKVSNLLGGGQATPAGPIAANDPRLVQMNIPGARPGELLSSSEPGDILKRLGGNPDAVPSNLQLQVATLGQNISDKITTSVDELTGQPSVGGIGSGVASAGLAGGNATYPTMQTGMGYTSATPTVGAPITFDSISNFFSNLNPFGNTSTTPMEGPLEGPTFSGEALNMNPLNQSMAQRDLINTTMVVPGAETARISNERQGFQPRGASLARGGYEGSAVQNQLLAQALGLNQGRSIVDQLKRAGGDSSFDARQNLYNQYILGMN